MKHHNINDQLASGLSRALLRESITSRPFKRDEYRLLPEFNWDVRSFDHCAANHLEEGTTDILHVVAIREKNSQDSPSNETQPIHYRAKILVACPASVLEGRVNKDDPFSISFKVEEDAHWKSDVGTDLEHLMSQFLNMNEGLHTALISTGHSNVNAWIEGFESVDYMAVNTSKRYSQLNEIIEFVKISDEIIQNLESFRRGAEQLASYEEEFAPPGTLVSCPKCGRNDRVEKVSVIWTNLEKEITSATTTMASITDWGGYSQSRPYAKPVSFTQVSDLTRRLSPPPMPLDRPPSKPCLFQVVGTSTFCFLIPGLGIAVPVLATILLCRSLEDFFVILKPLLTCVVPLFAITAGLMYWSKKLWIKHQVKVEQMAGKYAQETSKWKKLMRRWNQLYYCYRDEGVFIPEKHDFIPLNQIDEFGTET